MTELILAVVGGVALNVAVRLILPGPFLLRQWGLFIALVTAMTCVVASYPGHRPHPDHATTSDGTVG